MQLLTHQDSPWFHDSCTGVGADIQKVLFKIFLQIFLGNTSFGSEQTSLTLAAIHFQGKLRLLLYFEGNCSTTLVVAGLSMRGGEPPHYLRLTGNAALSGLGTIDFAANAMQGKKSKGEFCRLLERPGVNVEHCSNASKEFLPASPKSVLFPIFHIMI